MRLEKNGLVRIVFDPIDVERLIRMGYISTDEAEDGEEAEDEANGKHTKGKGAGKAPAAAN